ncbi:endothelin-converting enzyme 1-like [Centruroides sculpturatus]|uniref:endothelin-converting enzyme 1-like n=1 Tax=Centruroides sculpturatus TaxID=218467 RepID=UPI000C6DC048|nr:endothelin-converting enzyme 1-like [Centruroides sculpturatus]
MNRFTYRKITKSERYLILICIFFVIMFIIMTGLYVSSYFQSKVMDNCKGKVIKDVCTSDFCKIEAGSILRSINFQTDPCENFYEFVCGNYLKYETLNGEYITPAEVLPNYKYLLAKKVLEKSDEENDPPFANKVRKYYKSCLNSYEIKNAISNLLNLSYLDKWPVAQNETLNSTIEEAIVFGIFNDGTGLLFQIFFRQSFFYIKIGSTTVKSKVLSDQFFHIRRYRISMTYLLKMLGMDEKSSKNIIEEISNFEISLNQIQNKKWKQENIILTVSQLQKECPEINWKFLFQHIFKYLGPPLNEKKTTVKIFNINYIHLLCNLIKNTERRIIYNALLWNSFVPHLVIFDDKFRNMLSTIWHYFRYYSKRMRYKDQTLKWKNCINYMKRYIELGLHHMIIKSLNAKKLVKEVNNYIKQITDSLEEIFSEVEWINEEIKRGMKDKLNNIHYTIGYSNGYMNMEFLKKIFDNINITDNYVQNILSLNRQWLYDMAFNSPLIVEYYETTVFDPFGLPPIFIDFETGGQISLPLGWMFSPYYVFGVPQYLNYGGIFTVLSHEFSHGFQDSISLMRTFGNLQNKTKISKKFLQFIFEFDRRKNCLINQYSKFPIEGNLTVNGSNTFNDNFADNSGILVAFRAYDKYIKENGEEPKLPGLNYTNKQMFFIRYAEMWCETNDVQVKRIPIKHSPSIYRVVGPLMNLPEFSETFNCAPTSYMNPEKKCNVWR